MLGQLRQIQSRNVGSRTPCSIKVQEHQGLIFQTHLKYNNYVYHMGYDVLKYI